MTEFSSTSAGSLISITELTRRFDSKVALNAVNLQVPRGGVFGLIGGNGAGKTTLIRHILGMLKAQSGSVRVFGMDPIANPVEVLGRVGYLSEDRDLPNWMRIRELIRYTQAFYPTWDSAYANELLDAFDLDPKSSVRSLSRGQRARTGLLIALAHRPELLVLDEPSSGLDPVVRRDILGSNTHEHAIVVFPPEGTRKRTTRWKRGFYHVALGANVPVIMPYIDFKEKKAGMGPWFMPSGDIEKDFKIIADFCKDITAHNPEMFALPE